MPWHERITNAEPFWMRHTGPFKLCVGRPHKNQKRKPNTFCSEWLQGSDDGPECQEAAYALLTDPRDTINTVSVWSEREESFSMNYRRRDVT